MVNPAKTTTDQGRDVSAITLIVHYKEPAYIAGKMQTKFTFRGDLQKRFYKMESELLALLKTLFVEKATGRNIGGFAIYNNLVIAPAYPGNIILEKIDDVIIHDNTGLYPPGVFNAINKYKLI